MDNEWYSYRDNAYIKLAQEWIDKHIENAEGNLKVDSEELRGVLNE